MNYETLDDVLNDAWHMLEAGVEGDNAFNLPTLGTVGARGVSMRTVVLRRVIPDERRILCYSDVRSGKIEEIRANPYISWHFYDHDAKIQLRIGGETTLHTEDALADAEWASTPLSSRKTYCGATPTQAVSEPTSGLPAEIESRLPTEEESNTLGRPFFVVINTQLDFLDWLYLRREGHRRAQFQWNEGIHLSTWLTP